MTSSDSAVSTGRGQNIPSVNAADTLHSVLPSSFVAEESFAHKEKSIYTDTLNRITAYALGLSLLAFTLFSMLVDFVEEHYSLEIPLFIVCICAIIALLWLRDKKRDPMVSLMILGATLTILAIYLLVCDGPPDGSAMIWVAVFPSIILLCLSRFYGTIAFALLYISMLVLFFTPLESFMIVKLSTPMKIRLLLASVASFGFLWFMEYARTKTNLALHLAAYNIEQSSLTDTLTGLGNRRDFDRSLQWSMARAARNNSQYSLAILDIDHFKRVNDTYGHAVGDDVLRHIAHEVETQIRNADRIFRWGGEEFTIIMPSTSMEKAIAGAERVRQHIEETPFILGNEKVYLTVSLGIYSGLEANDPSYPLHIADQCLYRAKSTGRNKVVGGI